MTRLNTTNPTTGRRIVAASTSKYGNLPGVDAYGNRYDSKAEARRGQELDLLERAGQITRLRRQVNFPLKVNGQLITTYRADFCYFDKAKARDITEDVKGVRTREYVIKKKLMLALYEIEIFEVEA